MTIDIEDRTRLQSLRTAAIVMNEVANTIKDAHYKNETKSLAWTIAWAVRRIEELLAKESGNAVS